MNKLLKTILWTAISLAGAAALAAIAFERQEPLNAVWFVVAAVASYMVAYRFYSTFIAAKVLGPRRHARHSRRAPRRRQRFRPHQQMGPHRPSFRRHRRPRPARWSNARRAIRLFARHSLADSRRGSRRLRSGFHDAVLLHAPQRKISRSNGARRSREARRHASASRSSRHHGDSARCRGSDRSESSERFAVGHLHARHDHPHRRARGNLSALSAAGPRSRSLR